jgi:hypothetical protein
VPTFISVDKLLISLEADAALEAGLHFASQEFELLTVALEDHAEINDNGSLCLRFRTNTRIRGRVKVPAEQWRRIS